MKKKDMTDKQRCKQLMLNGASLEALKRNWSFSANLIIECSVEIVKDREKAEEEVKKLIINPIEIIKKSKL